MMRWAITRSAVKLSRGWAPGLVLLELVKVSAEVVGKLARVTAAITPETLGEVVIEVRAGTERFLARAADRGQTIPKHTRVVVVSSLGGRTVEVTPA
jgi:hypothetical protein